MNPATLLDAVKADGVTLILTPAGTIAAHGDKATVERWLPAIKSCKPELVAALSNPPKMAKNPEDDQEKGTGSSGHLREAATVDRYTTPETKWPEYRAALRSGALVLCLRCVHYSGPALDALGHCTAYRQEAAPDVPFWCESFKRKGKATPPARLDGPNWWQA